MLTGTLTHLTIKNCPNWWKAKKPVVRPKTVAVEELPAVFAYHAMELIVKSDRAQDAWKEVEESWKTRQDKELIKINL